jgi:hypothetical protein
MKVNPNTAAIWSGPEVEGRLKGMPTLIVTERATLQEVNHHSASFPHLFIEYGFALTHGIELIRKFAETKAISLLIPLDQLEHFPASECEGIHRVVTINAPGLDDLQKTDSVALFIAPYRTAYATCETLIHSHPDDYEEDNLIR